MTLASLYNLLESKEINIDVWKLVYCFGGKTLTKGNKRGGLN